MDITLLLVLLLVLLDAAVLYDIARLKCDRGNKVLYSLVVLLLPIMGVYISDKKIELIRK